MKKLNVLLAGIFFLTLFFNASAQTPVDYFVGKWEVTVVGTPNGDAKMIVQLERKEGKLTGKILRDGGSETPIGSIDEKDKSITVNFQSSGYDVYLVLEKKDDDHVGGSMMDMFDSTGVRIK